MVEWTISANARLLLWVGPPMFGRSLTNAMAILSAFVHTFSICEPSFRLSQPLAILRIFLASCFGLVAQNWCFSVLRLLVVRASRYYHRGHSTGCARGLTPVVLPCLFRAPHSGWPQWTSDRLLEIVFQSWTSISLSVRASIMHDESTPLVILSCHDKARDFFQSVHCRSSCTETELLLTQASCHPEFRV